MDYPLRSVAAQSASNEKVLYRLNPGHENPRLRGAPVRVCGNPDRQMRPGFEGRVPCDLCQDY